MGVGLKRKLSKLGGIFLLVFLFPSNLDAELWERELHMMKNAFMTGYFRALCLAEKAIARLKEDKEAMKKHIRAKAQEYMDQVRKLSR